MADPIKDPNPWLIIPGHKFEWVAPLYNRLVDGVPTGLVNLSGYHARCQGRTAPTVTPAVFDFDDADTGSLVTLGGAQGTLAVTMEAADTAALANLRGVWAIQVTNPSDEPIGWAYGEWLALPTYVYDDPVIP